MNDFKMLLVILIGICFAVFVGGVAVSYWWNVIIGAIIALFGSGAMIWVYWYGTRS